MDIVIISEFCEDFSITDNDRFLYLSKLLSSDLKDHNVEIITSSFRHTTKTHRREALFNWPFKISFIDEPGYKKNVCFQRFFSHYIWGKNVLKYLKSRKKPDLIYCAVPPLYASYLIAKYCKQNHIRFIIDVQDLWPESFKMVFSVPIVSSVLFFPFNCLANYVYKTASDVIAVSESFIERVKEKNKKAKHFQSVFLGTDIKGFDENVLNNTVSRENNRLVLGYSGTLGHSYNLPLVFDALKILKDKGVGVPLFLIIGDGPMMDKYKQYASDVGIDSIFCGRVAYSAMCGILATSDFVINPIVGKSVASIINKHADYAAVGKPVINTQVSQEYRTLIDNYKMGFNCKTDDPRDIANCIEKLSLDSALRIEMGRNARKCAEELFDRRVTYKKIISIILNQEVT